MALNLHRDAGEEQIVDIIDTQTLELIESDEPVEATLVDLVLAATELSEDETEVGDLIDSWIDRGVVSVRRAA